MYFIKQGRVSHLEQISSTQLFPPLHCPLKVPALRHVPKPAQDLRARRSQHLPRFLFLCQPPNAQLGPSMALTPEHWDSQQYERARVPLLSPPRRLTTSGTPQLVQEEKAHQALNLNGREGTCRNKRSSLQGIWAHASDGYSQRMNRSWFLSLSTPSRSQMLTHTPTPCFICLVIEEK